MKPVPTWFIVFLEIVVLILLTLHTYQNQFISDYISILLIVIMVLIPVVPNIKFLKYGPLETVIGEEDVRDFEESVENIPDTTTQEDPYEIFRSQLYMIGAQHVAAAVLAIRFEVEKVVRQLYEMKIEKPKSNPNLTLMLNELINSGVIDKDLKYGMKPFIILFNKTAHGEPVVLEDQTDFDIIVNSGIKILEYFYYLLQPNTDQ